MVEKTNNKSKKKFEFPHAFVLLFAMILIIGVLTYIVPAGQYNRIVKDGKTIVDPNSFEYIEQTPVKLFDVFVSIPEGLYEASVLIIMILLIGGAISVYDSSGAIKAAIMKLYKYLGDEKSSYILVAIIIFFGFIGAFPSMLEGTIPFAPICISISLALGYDVLVGIAISLGATVVGWSAGPTNLYTVGIGQSIGELPLFSGLGYRMLALVVFLSILIIFVLKYAKKIKEDSTKSLVYGMDTSSFEDYRSDNIEFTTRHKLILATFGINIFFVVYGAIKWHWGLNQMSGAYIIGAIIGGIIAGYNSGKIVDIMLEGMKDILIGVIAIGLARAIGVVMSKGNISDTIVNAISSLLQGYPATVTAAGMFIVQTFINFFIPSGSGQAMVTLPILLPVADIINLNRQIAILAFQFGDGLSNLCYPTVGALVAYLMYAEVPFNKWFKFIMPFILTVWAFSIALLVIAVKINYGPF